MSRSEAGVRLERVPQKDETRGGWTIKRADPERAVEYVIVSDDLLGVRTHYWRGRTIPCLIKCCEPCQAAHANRWHGYLLVINTLSHERVAFEFGPNNVELFDELRKQYGSLRGVKFVTARAQKKPNGRVVCVPRGKTENMAKLPSDEPIWPILAHLWGFRAEKRAAAAAPIGAGPTEAEAAQARPPRPRRSGVNQGESKLSDCVGQHLMDLDQPNGEEG